MYNIKWMDNSTYETTRLTLWKDDDDDDDDDET